MKTIRPLLLLLSALLLSPRAAAQCTPGPHSGTITADQTWCAADSPHALTGVVTVAPGVTLTIEAGTTVKPATIAVLGHLSAVGTAASPITFTSDGPGWESLTFSGGTGLLRHVDVLKAGWNAPGVVVANVTAPGVVFEHCNLGPGNKGMSVANGVVSITDSKLEAFAAGAETYPIVVSGAGSRLTLANTTFLGNRANEVVLETGAMTGADFTLAPQPGLVCYRFPGDYEVPAGRTVTLAAGTVVHEDWTFTVRGRLVSQGTAASPVTITSGRGTWIGLVFDGGTGQLAHTSITQADDRGVTVRNAGGDGVVLDHCTIGPASGAGGLVVEDSLVTATATAFTGITASGAYPVVVRGAASRLSLSGSSFGGNRANEVVLETGAMTGADFTLTPQPGLDCYRFPGDYEVPAGRTVTLAAGTTIHEDWTFTVKGRLVSQGTAASPVTVTSGRWHWGDHTWIGLVFEGGTGHLAWTNVSEADDRGVTVRNAGPDGVVLDHCTIGPASGAGGLVVEDSTVTATSTAFTGIAATGAYPVVVRGASSRLSLSDTSFAGNWANEVVLEPGAMTGADFTLTPQTGLAAYRLGDEYTIPEGRTLTVAAGVTLRQNWTTFVIGRLEALGTPSSPVFLTSGRWDSFGNPTWIGVTVDGGTALLRHTSIEHADALRVLNQGTLRLDRSRTYRVKTVRAETSTLVLRNAVVGDAELGLDVALASTLSATHVTLARFASGPRIAARVSEGSSAAFTNTIVASSPTGVVADGTSTVTMRNTLWDSVATPTAGPVTQEGYLTGSASFAADGFHVQGDSAALAQGVVTGLADDVDGEARPRPAGLLADLGADESEGGALIPGRTATPIAVGETRSGTAPAGAFADYVLELSGGATAGYKVRAEAASGVASLRLLLRHRQLPLETLFDLEGAEAGSNAREVDLDAPLPGPWYVSLLATGADAPFTLSIVRTGQVRSVTSISPASGGSSGTVTSRVSGSGFEAGSRVELQRAGMTLRTFAPKHVTGTEMSVLLDLSGLPSGTSDVAVVWPDGDTRLLPGSFTILDGGSAELAVRLIVPDVARPQRVMTVLLAYENTGSVDAPAPVFSIRSREGLGMRLSPEDSFVRGPLNVLGIDREGAGTAGTLPPGAPQWIPVQVFCEGADHSRLGFRVEAVDEGTGTPIDWAAQEASFLPPDAPADGWARLWASFTSDVGPTWERYATSLREAADALSARGRFVHGASRLLALRMSALAGGLLRGDLAAGLDVAVPSPGAPLALARVFPADVVSRYRIGPWGRGWGDLYWGLTAVAFPEGDVQVRSASGGVRNFVPLRAGGYRGTEGDPGSLATTASGFVLTERGGTVYRFRPDGRLGAVHDPFGNGVSLGYDGSGLLVSLAHTDGDVVALHRNGSGRIAKAVDHTGRETLYGYDGSGEHLVTVTRPGGLVTRYSYVAPGSAGEHALSSITFPDGRQRFFSYDGRGRNDRRWSTGDTERTDFEADSLGSVRTRDGLGNESSAGFDEHGRFATLVDAGGGVSRLDWDDHGNLSGAVTPGGRTANLAYGPLGDPELFVDPLGGVLSAGYAYLPTGGSRLASVQDAEGSATAFGRDDWSAIETVTFADGSRETVARDARGFPVSFTTRRGEVVRTQHDARGQVVRRDMPDGAFESRAYDELGRPVRAANEHGEVTAERDARGHPTLSTDSDGRSTGYVVDDGGRVTRRTAGDGFATEYEWDAAGRLLSVKDGSGRPWVTYEWDGAGRLARESKGNGTATVWSYLPEGRVGSVVNYGSAGQVLSSFAYTYDPDGNPVTLTTPEGTTVYGYDPAGQLVDVLPPDGRRLRIEYDRNGNRTRVVDGSTSADWTANGLNQVTSAGDSLFEYDEAGNLVTRTDASGTTTFDWNADGRLVRVVHPVHGTFEYDYDALGRRIAERHGASVRRWAWEGTDVVGEYGADGSVVARFVWGMGLVSRVPATGATAWYAFDAVGHTRQLTDESGAVVGAYGYGPFGEPAATTESIPNPFRWAGRFGVFTDAHGLLHMRARSYDPGLGRFVSPDPKRLGGGPHPYASAANSPLRFVDPNGTENTGMDVVNLALAGLGSIPGKAGYVVGLFTRIPGTFSAMDEIVEGGEGRHDWLSPAMQTRGLASLAFSGIQLVVGGATLVTSAGLAATLAPVVLVGGAVVAVSDFAIAQQIESYRRFERDFIENPPKRNPWARYREFQRPDGSFPDIVRRRVAEETGRPELVSPNDPNAKTATPGAGPRHRVRAGDFLTYQVHFQNVPTASAPAQEVFLEDPLDASLDLSTLRVVDVAWGDESLLPPADTPSFRLRTSVPDGRPGDARRWWVDVVSEIRGGGRLRLAFRTVDPETGELPEDPLAGFLPPDDATGRGSGHVTLRVRTRTGLPPGTRIANAATIVFDTEAPITTNEVFHTIGLPGDVNDDGVVDPADVFYLVTFLYSAGPAPLGIADANLDGKADALDLFYLINHLYAGGPAPL